MTDSALTANVPLEKLQTIGESSQSSLLRERSLSPEPIEGQPFLDFQSGHPNQDSEENSPSSPTASGPSGDFRSVPITKSNRTRTGGQKHKSAPPTSSKHKLVEGSVSGQRAKRQSTTLTTNTENSEAFHETAVWDQKTILALGMCHWSFLRIYIPLDLRKYLRIDEMLGDKLLPPSMQDVRNYVATHSRILRFSVIAIYIVFSLAFQHSMSSFNRSYFYVKQIISRMCSNKANKMMII